MRCAALLLLACSLSWGQSGGKETTQPARPAQSGRFLFPVAAEDYLEWTSPFGTRVSPLLKVLLYHEGIDLRAAPRAQVVAAADGWVDELWPPPNGYFVGHPVYGGLIVLRHAGGFKTLYAHLSAVYVQGWQLVKRGQVIGRIGSTGQSAGEHLHFEILVNGSPVNPILYVGLPR